MSTVRQVMQGLRDSIKTQTDQMSAPIPIVCIDKPPVEKLSNLTRTGPAVVSVFDLKYADNKSRWMITPLGEDIQETGISSTVAAQEGGAAGDPITYNLPQNDLYWESSSTVDGLFIYSVGFTDNTFANTVLNKTNTVTGDVDSVVLDSDDITEPSLSADGERWYTISGTSPSDPNENELLVVDTETMGLTRYTPVYAGPGIKDVIPSPDGQRLYLTLSNSSNDVVVWDAVNNVVLDTITLDLGVGNSPSSISAITTDSAQLICTYYDSNNGNVNTLSFNSVIDGSLTLSYVPGFENSRQYPFVNSSAYKGSDNNLIIPVEGPGRILHFYTYDASTYAITETGTIDIEGITSGQVERGFKNTGNVGSDGNFYITVALDANDESLLVQIDLSVPEIIATFPYTGQFQNGWAISPTLNSEGYVYGNFVNYDTYPDYPAILYGIQIATQTESFTITVSGTPNSGDAISFVLRAPNANNTTGYEPLIWRYAVYIYQTGDTLAMIAQGLCDAINAIDGIDTYCSAAINAGNTSQIDIIPAAPAYSVLNLQVKSLTGNRGTRTWEVARTNRHLLVTIWARTEEERERVGDVVLSWIGYLQANFGIQLSDNGFARIMYEGDCYMDDTHLKDLYRQDIRVGAEFGIFWIDQLYSVLGIDLQKQFNPQPD